MPNPDLLMPGEPMLLLPSKKAFAEKLMARLEAHKLGSKSVFSATIEDDQDEEDSYDIQSQVDQLSGDVSRIAVIPIVGMLMRGCAGFESWGFCDFETVSDAVQEAEDDERIKAIVLVIDSPGGCVNGTEECADVIRACNKPVLAFSAGLVCSAAYWLASGASAIIVSPSSSIGSIGCYIPFYDQTGFYDQMGVKVDLITSGAQKGAGYPGTSLSDVQRGSLQDSVNAIRDRFLAGVSLSRAVSPECSDGRVVAGCDAVDFGLADSVANDLSTAVDEFRALYL